jgi:hypothetical protein
MPIFKRKLPKEYTGIFDILASYLAFYGGVAAIIRSPYLHLSGVLLVPTIGIWSVPGWWDLPISILPNLISFTLAGYALFMGFGDEKFRQLMAGEKKGDAPMLEISATFTHFIIIQVIAVTFAILAKARPLSSILNVFGVHSLNTGAAHIIRTTVVTGFWMIAFCIFLYSMCCIVATTLSVFRVTRWFNQHHSRTSK